MIQRYCDNCGALMNSEEGRATLTRKWGRIKVDIYRSMDGCWNGGDVCHKCILKVIRKGSTIKF